MIFNIISYNLINFFFYLILLSLSFMEYIKVKIS